MIVVANLRLSGFFALVNAWVVRHVHRPIALLAAVTIVSGLFSAFLVNDAICLVLSPLVLELTLNLKRKPTPYLLAVAMASNFGSTATITGNPQNIMIGSFSHLSYLQFALALAPVAIVGLALTILLLALVHRTVDRREVGRRLNNRAENSHQPFRRRERAMQRFRSAKTLQKFSSVHAQVHNHFNQERHLVTRETYKQRRSAALGEWRALMA